MSTEPTSEPIRKRAKNSDVAESPLSSNKIMSANGDSHVAFDYDLAVIGGGSGGLAVAKKAASYGAKVVLFDFVKPSPHGTKWGLGGTCVNVGCVPKKLMHYAGLLGAGMHDAKMFGWKVGTPEHDWETMVETVQNHVKMLNFRYRVGLKSAHVTYVNGLARLTGPHEITSNKKGKETVTTAAKIVIAVGGRPIIPSDVPGAVEYGLTSDDLFSLSESPGKTLVVGASYIALECAGFMQELGLDVTVAVRSILLRGFDQQVAEKLGDVMKNIGVKFVRPAIPSKIEKNGEGKLEITLVDSKTREEVSKDTYDSVMYATGRRADTSGLGLEAVGVKINPNGKIPVEHEQTNVPHIYAIGDCTSVDVLFHDAHWANPELTPVAVQTGELLASRLYGKGKEQMDYCLVATAVFTPVEYGCCGLSEEDAIKLHGEDNIETYFFEFGSLEHQAAHRVTHVYGEEEEEDMPPTNLSKLVCLRDDGEKVIGFHYVGPNAGEITQGFALAVRLGAKKVDFDKLVGIHPTDAESFCAMKISRSSGMTFTAEGGCGGGVCG
ncbi:unnamed protein product [Ascophyllum nodosum]